MEFTYPKPLHSIGSFCSISDIIVRTFCSFKEMDLTHGHKQSLGDCLPTLPMDRCENERLSPLFWDAQKGPVGSAPRDKCSQKTLFNEFINRYALLSLSLSLSLSLIFFHLSLSHIFPFLFSEHFDLFSDDYISLPSLISV